MVKKKKKHIYNNMPYEKKKKIGKVNVFDYKNTHFTLIGTQYHNLPLKNIYKLLS